MNGWTQITKTIGLTLIRHRSDAFVSDLYLIDVGLMVFAIWENVQPDFDILTKKGHVSNLLKKLLLLYNTDPSVLLYVP